MTIEEKADYERGIINFLDIYNKIDNLEEIRQEVIDRYNIFMNLINIKIETIKDKS